MKSLCHYINSGLVLYGFSPVQLFVALRGTPIFLRDVLVFRRLIKGQKEWKWGKLYPCLEDRYRRSGYIGGHYFHQDLLVARRIFARKPCRHIDVGSRIDGFVAHVASFRKIEVIDIRPLDTKIPNVNFLQMDLMNSIPGDNLSDSLSCLHVLEHFGLGRYGDRIDPDGYRIGFKNLVGLLKNDGILYFSVPIGPQRIEFNSQRVFSISHLMELFELHSLEIIAFSYVNDNGDLLENQTLTPQLIRGNCDVTWGCGIFELRKRS